MVEHNNKLKNMKTLTAIIFIIGLGLFILFNSFNNTEEKSFKDFNDTAYCVQPSFLGDIILPANLKGYLDYNEGLSCSISKRKPYLIFFSKYTSADALDMTIDVLLDSVVLKMINEKFVLTVLFTDSRMNLPLNFQEISKNNGDTLKLMGEKNLYCQMSKFKEDVQPAFYIIDTNEKLLVKPHYFNLSIESFKQFLDEGLRAYKDKS